MKDMSVETSQAPSTALDHTEETQELFIALKAAEEAADAKELAAGVAAGRSWVEKERDVRALRRLQRFHEETLSWGGFNWCNNDSDVFGPAFTLYEAMYGDVTRDESVTFWQEVLAEDYPEGLLLEGFVTGALALWDEYQRSK
jgi:hypothetical protein